MRETALILILLLIGIAKPAWAQIPGVEVTSTYDVTDKETVEGDILITTPKGLIRSNLPSDNRMFGILQNSPVVVFRIATGTDKPVVRTGVADVNVTIFNGPIAQGDYITSSEITGKGQRTEKSGYTIGTALAPFDGSTGEKITYNGKEYVLGKVPVAVRIEYSEISSARSLSRLFDMVGSAFLQDTRVPGKFTEIVKYFVAGVIMLISFLFAFVTFFRSVPKAIEAIGRNPLARNMIYISMVFNIGLIVATLALGIFASIIVLRIK